MTTTTANGAPTALGTEPLSAALRAATRAEHEIAETRPFIVALMRGELTTAAYADLAAQHLAIYEALEAAGPAVRALPGGAALVIDHLERVPSIEADLAHLLGPAWRAEVRVLPATERYAAHLRAVAPASVAAFAAHAYVRYLGDLSGGQAIKAILQRSYGLPAEAVRFYTFDAVPKPKVFKDEYRALLDALPLDDAGLALAVTEAKLAFEFTTDLFTQLGAVHLP